MEITLSGPNLQHAYTTFWLEQNGLSTTERYILLFKVLLFSSLIIIIMQMTIINQATNDKVILEFLKRGWWDSNANVVRTLFICKRL